MTEATKQSTPTADNQPPGSSRMTIRATASYIWRKSKWSARETWRGFLWGLLAGGVSLFVARISCSLITVALAPVSKESINWWNALIHAGACPCYSLLQSQVLLHSSRLLSSPYTGPLTVVITALALFGFVKLVGRIRAFICSLKSGLLGRGAGVSIGFVTGIGAVVGLGGIVGFTWIAAHGAGLLFSGIWHSLHIAWVPIVALLLLLQPAVSSVHAWRCRKDDHRGIWSDDPIEDEESDVFGRTRLADSIVRTITAEGATIVALTGGYGEGKSSVLNFVEKKLVKSKPTPVVVRFNAWLPEDGATLTAAFFSALESAIQRRYSLPRLTAQTKNVLQVFLTSIPHAPSNVNKLLPKRSQQDDLDSFSSVLAQLPVPVVVLIDEIDRLNRNELDALFKLLRGLPSQSNLRFLCALDLNGVVRTLGDGNENDHWARYVEKFFPVRIPLGEPGPGGLRRYCEGFITSLQGHFEKSTGKGPWTRMAEISLRGRLLPSILNCPRRIKAIFSALRTSLGHLAGEVDVLDMFRLQAVTHLRPGLRGVIFDEWYNFVPPLESEWRVISIAGFTQEESRNKFFSRAFGDLALPENLAIVRLMGEMFPTVAGWAGIKGGLGGVMQRSAKRIREREYFSTYFVDAAESQAFSDDDIDALQRCASADDQGISLWDQFSRLIIETTAGSSKRTDLLRKFVQRVLPKVKEPEDRLAVAIGFVSLADQFDFPLPVTQAEDEQAQQAFDLVVACAKDPIGSLDLEIIEHCLLFSESTVFACRLMQHIIFNIFPSKPDASNLGPLQQIMASSLRDQFVSGQGMQSLFSYEWGSFRAIVLTWALCGSSARLELVNALQKEFWRQPIRLAQFLKMTYWNPAMIRLVPEFEFENVGSSTNVKRTIASLVFTDLNALRQFAIRILAENKLTTLPHRSVVEQFLQESGQSDAGANAGGA